MKKRDMYSWAALALIVIGEAFAFCSIRFSLCPWVSLSILVCVLLVSLWAIGRRHNHRFSLSSVILTKLLANAITPRTLGTIYLLFFVTHLGWLANASMGLFLPAYNLTDTFIAVGVSLAGIFALIVSFPNGEQKKTEHPRKIFVSGISTARLFQTLDKSNLHPIVRILQLTDDTDDCCELYILHSDYFSAKEMNNTKINNVNDYWAAALTHIDNEDIRNAFDNRFKAAENITDRLGLLIRILAIVEFPRKKWLYDTERMKITFSEVCDYNAFGQCFTVLDKIVKKKDNFENLLFFNLTPGNANISAIMTLLAIDGDRKLYYYKPLVDDGTTPKNELQSKKEVSEEEKMTQLIEVNKTDIPLQNLLSQALDSFEMGRDNR